MVESFTPSFLLVAFLVDFFSGLLICSLRKFYLCMIYLIMQNIFFLFTCVDFIYVCVKLMYGLFAYVQSIYLCMVYLFVCLYLHTIYF